MKAVIHHRVGEPFRIVELSVPEPGPGEVLIRVKRCGICRSDVTMTSGIGWQFPTDVPLGHEYAGEVVALGRGVTRLRQGDRIVSIPVSSCGTCEPCRSNRPLFCEAGYRAMMGGFGEFTLVDERFAIKLPDNVTYADGALCEPLASALNGMKLAGITLQTSVLVIGVGAIGAGSVYWARRLGAANVMASARSAWRAELAAKMGATGFIETPALSERLVQELGGAPDVVVECTGAPGMLAMCIDLVKPCGTIVGLGICPTEDRLIPAVAVGKQLTIRFSSAYGYDEFHATVDALASGAVQPRAMIEETIPLSAVPDAVERMRAGKSLATKIMVDTEL
jgi:threonine dehydrogenase-like Zn-dependent dehydrogenase